MNPQHTLQTQTMNSFQWFAIIICVLLNVIDGFDVMVMAFTANAVSTEWALSGAQLGTLFSAGLLGMCIGSLVIAPISDKLGRRSVIMVSLALSGISMALSGLAQSAFQLGIFRVLTGMGVGAILACSNVICSEYTATKWKSFSISLLSVGYATGATFGGLFAIYLNQRFGWRSVFMTGGIFTLLLIIGVYFRLPESLDFLINKHPKNALQRINAITAKLALNPLSELPAPSADAHTQQFQLKQLFSNGYFKITLRLWAAYFFIMFGVYFVMSWTPKLLVHAGLSDAQGITAGILISVGGIFGAIIFGYLSSKFAFKKIQIAFFILSALVMFLFVGVLDSLSIAFAVAIVLGLLVNGSIASLYATAPVSYPASCRATGVGYAIGMGRAGAIVSPLVAGYFLDASWETSQLYSFFALAFVIAIFVVIGLRKNLIH